MKDRLEDQKTEPAEQNFPVWLTLGIWVSEHILLALLVYSVVLILLYEYFINYFLPFFGI